MPKARISACLSRDVVELVQRHAKAQGIKRSQLIEQALLQHLRALRELPADIPLPPRLVLTEASFAQVSRLLNAPRRPNRAMRELMARKVTGGKAR